MHGLLAIESSQRAISVAIRCRDGSIVQRNPIGDPREKDLLLPAIVALCADANIARSELLAVAISTGPGGFTGLRVGIATAKGMCEALSIPAIDVPSAIVAAMGVRSQWWPRGREVVVALAAKGDECWMTTVDADDEGELSVRSAQWSRWNVENAIGFGNAMVLIADDHLPVEIRQRAIDTGITILPPTFQATDCLAVAEAMLLRGEVTDSVGLRVRYPREPEAVTIWRARYPDGFTPKK